MLASLFGLTVQVATPALAIIDGRPTTTLNGQVQFWVEGDYACAGTLINVKWVLTARHCVEDTGASTGNSFILIGDHRLGEGASHTINRMIVNPTMDAALLELSAASNQPHQVVGYGLGSPQVNQLVSTRAWGPWDPNSEADSDVLRAATLRVRDNSYDYPDIGPPGVTLDLDDINQGVPEGGDSGAGVYFQGRIFGVLHGGDGASLAMALKTDAIAPWIQQVSGVQPWSTSSASNLRIMPLGDSITYGVGSSTLAGYRKDLLAELSGVDNVNFVGSQNSGSVSDADHEGHPGRRIDEIAKVADCSIPLSEPNVVLLDAGTNDINQGQLAEAPGRLGSLIDQILADVPSAVVLVSEMGPSTNTALQPKLKAFNDNIRQVVAARAQQGKHVRVVEQNLTTADLSDVGTVHPNDAGYKKMASAWAAAIYDVAYRGWLKNPAAPAQDASNCGTPDPTNIGDDWKSMGVVAPGMGGAAGRIDLVELNGDNRADYVKIFPNGSVRAALNTKGTNGKPDWVDQGTIAPGVGQPGESVRFADMNGDGRDDYLILGAKGSVWSYLNDRGTDGKFHWTNQGRLYPYFHGTKPVGDESGIDLGWEREDVRLADVSGDGQDDYLVVGPAGSMDAYLRAPDMLTWTKIDTFATGVTAGPRARMRLGDVNGDRKADYLIVGSTGAVHAYINHMQGMSDGNWSEHKYFANQSNYPDTTVAFRDITGDGKADYLVVEGEKITAWENLGGISGTPTATPLQKLKQYCNLWRDASWLGQDTGRVSVNGKWLYRKSVLNNTRLLSLVPDGPQPTKTVGDGMHLSARWNPDDVIGEDPIMIEVKNGGTVLGTITHECNARGQINLPALPWT
ncbi:GDSL-type esterase/lipase family protein [Streptomyces sp. 2A115]|uniref:GDSL-type esterase/lipase family protein n=1 Tax=Streptomyces sp. 2A115 TaxID=3457439 RepID=UPI003FD39444